SAHRTRDGEVGEAERETLRVGGRGELSPRLLQRGESLCQPARAREVQTAEAERAPEIERLADVAIQRYGTAQRRQGTPARLARAEKAVAVPQPRLDRFRSCRADRAHRALQTGPPLLHQRQEIPQRIGRRGELDTHRRIAVCAECPVERNSNVV